MSSVLKSILLVFRELFHLVFPLSEDEKIIEDLTPTQFVRKLNIRDADHVKVLSNFKDPEVRATIHLVKFHHHPLALELAASLLETWLQAQPQQEYVIIPIPLSQKRERERGYNQTSEIAIRACRHLENCTVRSDLLERSRHTAPQTSLPRAERLKNLAGAFTVNVKKCDQLAGVHIVIFDDVMTTGATLQAAKAALLPHTNSPITCVALAH